MGKLEAERWSDEAWMNDKKLSLCRPATRGVWKDLLIAMRLDGCTGELRGTAETLAQLARCSAADMALALTDLQTTGAADISERNGVVTVVNRRMSRAAEVRRRAAERQRKHRTEGMSQISCADVFGKPPDDHCDGTLSVSPTTQEEFSLSSEEKKPLKKEVFVKPTIEEVREFCASEGHAIDAEQFWHHYEAIGWVLSSGRPVKKWRSCVVTWAKRQGNFNGNRNNRSRAAGPGNAYDASQGLGSV